MTERLFSVWVYVLPPHITILQTVVSHKKGLIGDSLETFCLLLKFSAFIVVLSAETLSHQLFSKSLIWKRTSQLVMRSSLPSIICQHLIGDSHIVAVTADSVPRAQSTPHLLLWEYWQWDQSAASTTPGNYRNKRLLGSGGEIMVLKKSGVEMFISRLEENVLLENKSREYLHSTGLRNSFF